jgi:hypothetical protein
VLGVPLAASACVLVAAACESSGGGGDCFPPEHGPSSPSCAGYDVGLVCPVGTSAWYTCLCTQGGSDAGQTWVCAPAGSSLTGGGGGSGGSGGGGAGGSAGGSGGSGVGGDAGADGG